MRGSTRGDGTDVPGQPLHPSRRTVLGLASAASLAAAAALGLRLDLPQPPPPVPTRRPVVDEKLLVGLVHDLERLRAEAAAVTNAGSAARTVSFLSRILSEQTRVVTGRLTNEGVPTEVIQAPTRSASTPSALSASATATPTASDGEPRSTTATLAQLKRDLTALTAADWAAAAAATEGNRELVVSIRSVHLTAGSLLGAPLTFRPNESPVRSHLVERTEPLVYGFEVVAAQSSGAARTRALTALGDATELLRALGSPSTTTPGGWALPFPVTTTKEATRLAEHLLGTAIAATTSLAQADPDAASLQDIATWSARVQVLAAHWGLPLSAFPGMAA